MRAALRLTAAVSANGLLGYEIRSATTCLLGGTPKSELKPTGRDRRGAPSLSLSALTKPHHGPSAPRADLTPVVNEAEHLASVKGLGLSLSARTSAKTGDGVNQVQTRPPPRAQTQGMRALLRVPSIPASGGTEI